MPAKNTVKIYIQGGCYHLYNRGVEKRHIFQDREDYITFINLLKMYLSLPKVPKGSDPKSAYYGKKNLHGQIELLAYCLMPNHFHLLVRQQTKEGITNLMRCINTNYVVYFNKKYNRVGSLFQGRYKAVLVENDAYLLHLSRYIHLNPASFATDFAKYAYSSYMDYLNERITEWLNRDMILNYFKRSKRHGTRDYFSYEDFVSDYKTENESYLEGLVLEED